MATHVRNKATTTTWEIGETGDTWILGEHGSITGTDIVGIMADNSIEEATIRVDGAVDLDGLASMGVYLQTQMGAITVSDTGHVSAGIVALYYENGAGTVSITNEGLLEGDVGIAAATAQNGAEISNGGRILASINGISQTGAGASIANSGVIKAWTGITIAGAIGDTNATHIVNSGKLTGSHWSILATDVDVSIRNTGTLNGDIWLVDGDGDDVVNNRGGTINGDVWLGAGNDVVKAAGGTLKGIIHGGLGDDSVTLASPATLYVELAGEGYDTVRINSTYQLGENIENLTLLGKANHTGIGNGLNNTITGNKGANVLYGLDGFDTLDGGRGNDLLTGGDGDTDMFVFRPSCGRDTVTDFEDGLDYIAILGIGMTFAEVQDSTTIKGDDIVITLSDTDRIILRGAVSDGTVLDAADFIF